MKPGPGLWIVLGAALLPRLTAAVILGDRLVEPRQDQFIFAELADGVVHGRGLALDPERFESKAKAWRAEILNEWVNEPGWAFGLVQVGKRTSAYEPLYPYTLAGVRQLGVGGWLGARLINLVWGIVAAAAAYFAGLALAGRSGAFWAGLCAALYPAHLYYGLLAMGEAAHIGLLALTLAAFYVLWERGPAAAVPFGLSAAAFFLTRSIALPVFIGLLVLFLLVARAPRKLLAVLIAAAVFGLALAPWIIRNYSIHNTCVVLPTRAGVNLWMRNNPRVLSLEPGELGDRWEDIWPRLRRTDLLSYPVLTGKSEVERDRELQRRMVAFIKENPSFFAEMCGRRLITLIKPYGPQTGGWPAKAILASTYILALVLAGAGLRAAFRNRNWKGSLPLVGVFLFYIGYHSLIHGGVRYRLPADIGLLILAGCGMASFVKMRRTPAT